jgi:transaldolase
MSQLLKLKECGQSYWLDNLSREIIKSGELKRRVEKEGLMGLTSNPDIFHKAISKSRDYDEQIAELAKITSNTREVYEGTVIRDIQDACDILRKVYDETEGVDGFVSLEVSPHLARDTKGTEEEVKRLFHLVDRPNCFIKIPGTAEGIPAIERMLYEGININITLLFSVKVYEEVAHAYIRALRRRKDESKPIDKIRSVASFFLSRIDVLVDQLLHHRLRESDDQYNVKVRSLLGKVAIANAKMAYQSFLRIFSGDEWEELVSHGAQVQRPLWASTSTKNPDYNDVMYVDTLIGKDTVNTMPDQTVKAFLDHGKIAYNTILQEIKEAEQTLVQLESLGIDLDSVTSRLVDEGIQKFIDPHDKLMELIQEKVKQKG